MKSATKNRMKRTRPVGVMWGTRRVLLGSVGLYAVVCLVVLMILHQRAQETRMTAPNNSSRPNPNPFPQWKTQKMSQGSAAVRPVKASDAAAAAAVAAPTARNPLREEQQQRQEPKLDAKKWNFDRGAAEARLAAHGASSIRQPIAAFVERTPYPPPDAILSMGDRGDMKNEKDFGKPTVYKTPLPLRTQTPSELQKVVYPKVQTCHDMPQGFPVDQGLQFDEEGEPIVWNVGDKPTPPDFPQRELSYCPVEADPYLPWIHDLFPSPDGRVMHILAQNKRRCRTGKKFTDNVNRLLPQVALMQPVSVKRVTEQEARTLAPDLWHVDDDDANGVAVPRYQYVPMEQASPDGQYTRFICRFHSLDFSSGMQIVLEETLSAYTFNYELAAYRKGHVILHTPKGKDARFFWTSNLHFTCPVPERLQPLVKDGTTVLSDGTPTLWLDIVPMRSPARFKSLHMGPDMIGPFETWAHDARPWNVTQEMGETHILPDVTASGRWANLPVCPPYKPHNVTKAPPPAEPQDAKPHYLSACLWASAEFKTRGQHRGGISDTLERLYEWLTFHFAVGFDHVYVYDNSAAHTNSTNLDPILRLFGDRVTRIEWPSIVCNNNIPAHDSTGERSSQYAAENSCRTRYAPYTEWIASFDTDEYFVPMGKYTNLPDLLRDVRKGGTNILSFRSSRGKLRQEFSVVEGKGRVKMPNATFLDTYNCDSAGSPKPSWADRARKQIYRADYVLHHHVHYSTVCRGHMQTFAQGYTRSRFGEHRPSERVVDEEKEAVLVHTKTIAKDMTNFYLTRCRNDYGKKWQGCYVAYPWPNGKKQDMVEDANGMEYNCFINPVVEQYWGPRLRQALQSAPLVLSS